MQRKRAARDSHGAAAHLRAQYSQVVVVMMIIKATGLYLLTVKHAVASRVAMDVRLNIMTLVHEITSGFF
jgi:hypothetical protein